LFYLIELLDFGLSVFVVGACFEIGDHGWNFVVLGVQIGETHCQRVLLGLSSNVLHDLLDESDALGGARRAAPSVGGGVRADLLAIHFELGALVAVVEVRHCRLQGRVVQVAARVLDELCLQVLDLALVVNSNLTNT